MFTGASTQEQHEKQETVQDLVDRAFFSYFTESVYEQDPKREYEAAGNRILEKILEERLGESYHVSSEGDYLSLAVRSRLNTKWEFDPKERLGIFWEEEFDLAAGRMLLKFEVNQKMKDSDGDSRRDFTVELFPDETIEYHVSSATIELLHAKLEIEHEKEMALYREKLKEYEMFTAWAKDHLSSREKFDSNDMELPECAYVKREIGNYAEKWSCQNGWYKGADRLEIIAYGGDGSNILNIFPVVEPEEPVFEDALRMKKKE